MSVASAATGSKRASGARALARFVLPAFGGSTARPLVWSFVRGLAVIGFLLFGALTTFRWLRLDLTTPMKGERIDVRATYAVSAIEQDVALLAHWLPATGKIGYLSEKPDLVRFETRMRLAPRLLDYDWQKHPLLLVDFPVKAGRALVESPSYQLLTDLPEAKAFARGMRIYRRTR